MVKTDRIAGFFIILAGLYYSWNAYVIPVRADEAFLFLKSTGYSWHTIAPASIMEFIIKGFTLLDSTSLNLRMPSIIFVSLSALLIFQHTFFLAGRNGAWFSMILFFVMPSVTYSYVSASSPSLFIFTAALYIYSMYMVQDEKDAHIKYYIWASIAQFLLISTHYTGILFIILPFIYLFFNKELIKNKKYMITAILGVCYTVILFLLHFLNVFEFFYKYPIYVTEKNLFKYLLLFIVYMPFFYIIFIAVKDRKIDDKVKFLFVSSVFLCVFSILFNLNPVHDIRFTAAFMVPAVILAGYFYEMYGYKILLAFITTIFVLVSAYTNISKTSELTPKYMENTRLYESIRLSIQDLVSYGDSIYSFYAGLSSVLVYNSFPFLEACTLDECKGNAGVFISTKKEENLDKYFHEVKEVNIYRAMSLERKEITKLYFYTVNGLKIEHNKNNKFYVMP